MSQPTHRVNIDDGTQACITGSFVVDGNVLSNFVVTRTEPDYGNAKGLPKLTSSTSFKAKSNSIPDLEHAIQEFLKRDPALDIKKVDVEIITAD